MLRIRSFAPPRYRARHTAWRVSHALWLRFAFVVRCNGVWVVKDLAVLIIYLTVWESVKSLFEWRALTRVS